MCSFELQKQFLRNPVLTVEHLACRCLLDARTMIPATNPSAGNNFKVTILNKEKIFKESNLPLWGNKRDSSVVCVNIANQLSP